MRPTLLFITLILMVCPSFAWSQGQSLIVAGGGHVSIAEPTSTLTGVRTFEAWVLWTGQNPLATVMADSNCAQARWEIGHSAPGTFVARWWNSSLNWADVALPEPPIGEWMHIAVTWDSTTLTSFINGQLYASTALTGAPAPRGASNTFRIGGSCGLTNYYWDGLIDEVRVWSIVRSQAEIQSTLNAAISTGNGLISVWHFDGTAEDAVGVNDGVLQGNASYYSEGVPVPIAFLTAPTRLSPTCSTCPPQARVRESHSIPARYTSR
jgi:hypothetical protein